MRKGRRSWERVLARSSRMSKHKIITFYHTFGNSYSCTTAVKWDVYNVENTKARRCHLVPKDSSRFHPGNRAELFIWPNFPARLPMFRWEKPGQPALSYDMNTSKSRNTGLPGQPCSCEEALSSNFRVCK